MTKQHRLSNEDRKQQMFERLRREILAARLKVTLDEQFKRETSPTVKALAGMKLPPATTIIRNGHRRVSNVRQRQADSLHSESLPR